MFVHLWKRRNGPTVCLQLNEGERAPSCGSQVQETTYPGFGQCPESLLQHSGKNNLALHTSLKEVNVSKATYSIYKAPLSLVSAPHNHYFW